MTAPSSGGITHISITHDSTGLSRTYIIASGIIDVAMLGLKDGTDRTSYFPQVASKLSLIGFDKIYHNHASSVGPYAADILNYMQNSRILIIRSHGSGECVVATDRYLMKSEIEAMENNSLSNLDLIFFGICEGAYGGSAGDNMVTATVNKGAGTAIGFQNMVNPDAANDWVVNFFDIWYTNRNSITGNIASYAAQATALTLEEHSGYVLDDGGIVTIENCVVYGSNLLPEY